MLNYKQINAIHEKISADIFWDLQMISMYMHSLFTDVFNPPNGRILVLTSNGYVLYFIITGQTCITNRVIVPLEIKFQTHANLFAIFGISMS